VIETARRAGIASPLGNAPSIALGAYEVTPLELVTAYAPFANGGARVTPRLVTRIEAVDGGVLWEGRAQRTPVMDPRDAFLLTSMLRSVVDEGTGRAVREWGVRDPVAGKTGTTNGGTDVWFVGYTPTLVAGFWFGHDTPRPIATDASGGRWAAPAWADFYAAGWRERNVDWQPPPGLATRRIDASNGLLANEYCPRSRDEWFREGQEPTRRCDWHTEPVYEPDWSDQPEPAEPSAGDPAAVERAAERATEAAQAVGKKTRKWFQRVFKW
jgi:penicillin-binding protein 1A